MKRLIIIDYFFIDNKGHDGKHDLAIAYEALRQGIRTEVICPKSNTEQVPSFVEKRLRSPSAGRKGLRWYALDAISRFFELRRLIKIHKTEKETVFFVSTIDDHFLVSLFLAVVGLRIAPKITVMVRRGLKEYTVRDVRLRTKIKVSILSQLMKYLYRKKNTLFCSDSELIVADLVSQGLTNSVTLPVILRLNKGDVYSMKDEVVGYVGGARFDKGFDMLPFIVEKMIHKRIKFLIQTYVHGNEKKELVSSARKSLQAFSQAYPKKVELIDTPLSEVEYASLLQSCSIIVFPYRKQFYGQGISGILAEVIAIGAWAIVPAESWLSAQQKKYEKIVVMNELSADAIVTAIDACIRNEKRIKKEHIEEQINVWQTFHSAEKFIEIVSRVGGA